jgi:N-methylhydantoinase A
VKEGFAEAQHAFVRTADLRYFGQAFEVRVPVPDGEIDDALLAEVADRFHAEHRALYGYDFSGDATQQVEWVNLRVSGIGPIRRPEIRRHVESGVLPVESGVSTVTSPDSTVTSPDSTVRGVCFDPEVGYVDTPVLWRDDLRPGATIVGPAIIEEFGSTVPLHPGFTARVDDHLNLVVTRSES